MSHNDEVFTMIEMFVALFKKKFHGSVNTKVVIFDSNQILVSRITRFSSDCLLTIRPLYGSGEEVNKTKKFNLET